MLFRFSFHAKIACLLISATFAAGCVRSFTPPAITSAENILVVDGFINAGNDSTYIYLSRSGPLSDTTVISRESKATISIECTDNSITPLQEASSGSYSCPPFNPSKNVKYRIHIKTSNGNEYRSDFVPVQISPSIDSVTWARIDSGGVTIYVNTQNDIVNARYYRWQFQETWEFHPFFKSLVEFDSGAFVNRIDYLPLYSCWRSDRETSILIGSSAALGQNVIYQDPIETIPNDDEKLSVQYSILVQQQSIDQSPTIFFSY